MKRLDELEAQYRALLDDERKDLPSGEARRRYNEELKRVVHAINLENERARPRAARAGAVKVSRAELVTPGRAIVDQYGQPDLSSLEREQPRGWSAKSDTTSRGPHTGELWIKIRCPHCGTLMPPPFARLRVAVCNTHAKQHDPHGNRCRVIVLPDVEGDNHEVYLVKDGETLENAMERVLRRMAA